MPFRPSAAHRRNVRGVIYPLTAAVARMFGIREDGAYPIGAFYPIHIDNKIWRPVGGIWYIPKLSSDIDKRNVREEDIACFSASIANGQNITLRSGITVKWEPIPAALASQLPSLTAV